MENQSTNQKSSKEGVKELRNGVLRIRFEKAIEDSQMSRPEFYKRVGISRQYYYQLSYGIFECSLRLKLKIGQVLGCDSASIFEVKEKHVSDLKKFIKEGVI